MSARLDIDPVSGGEVVEHPSRGPPQSRAGVSKKRVVRGRRDSLGGMLERPQHHVFSRVMPSVRFGPPEHELGLHIVAVTRRRAAEQALQVPLVALPRELVE